MVNITPILITEDKWDIKCPYGMTPEYITVHNTANDASARDEISYMTNRPEEVSFHFAVDNQEIIQAIPLDRNAWHSADGQGDGNRKSIAIEICYSESGGGQFDQAEIIATQLIAKLLKDRGWGVDRIKKHQDWSGKYCPHRTMDKGWPRFVNMVQAELDILNGQLTPTVPQPQMSVDQVANEVIAGQWGDGAEREANLTNAGYNYTEVQNRVNEKLGSGTPSVAPTQSSKQVLHLPKEADSWRVYPLDKSPNPGNECGVLKPSQFGGLDYDIEYWVQQDIVCVINTRDFGTVQIYVANGTGATWN